MLAQVQRVDVVTKVTLSPGPKGKGVQIVMDIQLTLAFIHVVTDGLSCMLLEMI